MKKALTTEFLMNSFQQIQKVVNLSASPLPIKELLQKLNMSRSVFRQITEKGDIVGMVRIRIGNEYDEIRYSNVDFVQTEKVERQKTTKKIQLSALFYDRIALIEKIVSESKKPLLVSEIMRITGAEHRLNVMNAFYKHGGRTHFGNENKVVSFEFIWANIEKIEKRGYLAYNERTYLKNQQAVEKEPENAIKALRMRIIEGKADHNDIRILRDAENTLKKEPQ